MGPAPLEEHVDHALGFGRALGSPAARALDLGAGGGIPGLVLALAWPDSTWVLLDAQARRVEFLRAAVGRLGLSERVDAVHARAEDAGRAPALRGTFDAVTARSFGPPAVTAECGGAFLGTGGRLVVSEPPEEGAERWPSGELAVLGLTLDGVVAVPARYAILTRREACPERFPRRPGVPVRRPLF